MEYELGQDVSTAPADYGDWIYAFCQNEKISSKKLIEEIASASPFLPRFNNMGNWEYIVIQEYYDQTDIDGSTRILESDVIKYSYSRSKIEDVKTAISFHYNFDYGLDEYQSKTEFTIENVLSGGGSGYSRNYYGLDGDDDSTLVVDDRRGFYIRDDATADSFAIWLLRWQCNQHLKIKLKLPLNYLDIEVGSLISFDKVLGDVLPYGINYKHDAIQDDGTTLGNNINGQQAFSLFLCTSTNKTLEYIDIEVIQLHNLGATPVTRNSFIGCASVGNWNTFEGELDVLHDAGLCVNEFDFIQPLCGFEDNLLNDDSSNNYDITNIHPENADGSFDTSTILPNVFIVGIHDDAIASAKAYWEEQGRPMPWENNAPKIYDYSMCTWQNTNYHILDSISVYIKNANGNYISFGTIENNVINIQLNSDMVELYQAENKLNIKFVYAFNTAVEPTFAGGSVFTYDCLTFNEYGSFSIIGEQSNENPYNSGLTTGQYESEVITNNLFDIADIPDPEGVIDVYEFILKYNLAMTSNTDLTEILGQATIRFSYGEPEPYFLGDINQDGVFNVLDVLVLVSCVLAEDSSPCEPHGDMNQDGQYNVLDVVALLNCVLAETCDE